MLDKLAPKLGSSGTIKGELPLDSPGSNNIFQKGLVAREKACIGPRALVTEVDDELVLISLDPAGGGHKRPRYRHTRRGATSKLLEGSLDSEGKGQQNVTPDAEGTEPECV